MEPIYCESPIKVVMRGNFGDVCYQTLQSAAADVCSQIETAIPPGEVAAIDTGLYIEEAKIQALGNMLLVPQLEITPRSGLALKSGITVLNSPGIIDADYREQIKVILINLGKSPFFVERGMRVAQIRGSLVFKINGIRTKDLVRSSGFGSTGV